MTEKHDPVYLDEVNDDWYFYDETWSHSHGPYATEEEARVMLKSYFEWLNTGVWPDG